jgi:predicted nuclease of predicted toxin-antitoxin system
MKFLADMGISPQTVSFLLNLGYQASHLQQQGLHRLSDSEILQKAQLDGSILLTLDLDFGDLLAASEAELPSVIIFRLRNMRPERVNEHLTSILTKHAKELEKGSIITITEGAIRIRPLPIVAKSREEKRYA